MQPSYRISTFIHLISLILATSTYPLVPDEDLPSLLWATGREVCKVKISSSYPQVDSEMNAPVFSDFTVHVFVNHDPFIASILLPDLFSEFPESAWRLPQEIATPPRPDPPPNPIPQDISLKLMTSPREGLGRHVFPDALPYSTTLRELSHNLEQEFGLNRELLAQFTIFPQFYQEDGTLPEWHRKPLPWHMTLGEVAFLDVDAVGRGQYAGIADEFAPVLHIVIETKAAALQRSLGGVVGKKFYEEAPEEEYKHENDMWSRLASFTNAFHPRWHDSEIADALQQWRSSFHSLAYLTGERAKLIIQEPIDDHIIKGITQDIEKYQTQEREAKATISALASQWEKWVLKQDSHLDLDGNEELRDDEVEVKVMRILRQRIMVVEWGMSKKKKSLLEMLQSSYSQSGHYLIFDEQQQPVLVVPEKLEEQLGSASKVAVAEEPCDPSFPNSGPVSALSFRLRDGTLSHELAKFTIKSGILSWGQILPIYYGSLQGNLTNNAAKPLQPLPEGTIRQHVYTYKSAARTGDWKVRRYYSHGRPQTVFTSDSERILYNPDAERFQAGWIFCHGDIDPWDIVKRVRALGSEYGPGAVSNGNEHTDKDVVYIGRYDWSYAWHSPQDPDFEDKFYDWAKTILEPYKNREVPPFPEETQEQPQNDMLEEKRNIALKLCHKLEQVFLNQKRPPQDNEIPLMAEYISRLEQLPDSDTGVFRNAYMLNVLRSISILEPIPRDDEFGIKKRANALHDKWSKLLAVDPVSNSWYYAAPPTGINEVSHGRYFIAMDSDDFDLDFIEAYKCVEAENRFMREVTFSKGERRFGAYVSSPRMMGDEFGWLVFSGKKHEEHDADELIAIVYDGTYEVFQALYHNVEPER